jgi:iduronate 2-sulfatase
MISPHSTTRRLLVSLFALAISAGYCSAESAGKGPEYDIFLLVGQSNMDGRGPVAGLRGELGKFVQPRPDVKIGYSIGGLHRPLRLSSGFESLRPGCSGTPKKIGDAPPTNTFGPEVSFGATMADALPNHKILLLKVAEGGTSLAVDWNPQQPDKLYARFLKYVDSTQTQIREQGGTGHLLGMVWMQGESDSNLPDGKYRELLIAFIAKVRVDLAAPALPFVIGQVYDNGKRDHVIAAQKAVAHEIPATGFASAAGLKTIDAGTHFDAASQIQLGSSCAKEMLRLISPAK